MEFSLPAGFSAAGVHCGVKKGTTKLDLSMIVADSACVAGGVYTQNRVFAAPVGWDRARTPSSQIRGVVINSGNANACTGSQGEQDVADMARIAAASIGADADEFLVLSTGVIGELMPMHVISKGIAAAADGLGHDETSLINAAKGMMTTDNHHKLAQATVDVGDGQTVQITGLAKGAAMIGPNMATMLGVILTDAKLSENDAQSVLSSAVADSFNCISVEGHTSTNDTVLLLASGNASTQSLQGAQLAAFAEGVRQVCIELAKSIPNDGEGATHLIEIRIQGLACREDAYSIAKSVADSALVKTAIHGADPNWGRIVSAAGYAGVEFDPQAVRLFLNGTLLYEQGTPVGFDEVSVSDSIRNQRVTEIDLEFGEGEAGITFWTCDMTAEYIRLNADYRT